ncbi:MAG TPA: hypothetical protein VEL28_05205 [Candidatus Binatia bacterium]|nr:hypothetical protein [Candidatus Binatia bacterium]
MRVQLFDVPYEECRGYDMLADLPQPLGHPRLPAWTGARQRSMTSAGSRIVMSLRGLVATGLPPFFTTTRESISSVSSGASSYSCGWMTRASTFAMSDPEFSCDTRFFAGIGRLG